MPINPCHTGHSHLCQPTRVAVYLMVCAQPGYYGADSDPSPDSPSCPSCAVSTSLCLCRVTRDSHSTAWRGGKGADHRWGKRCFCMVCERRQKILQVNALEALINLSKIQITIHVAYMTGAFSSKSALSYFILCTWRSPFYRCTNYIACRSVVNWTPPSLLPIPISHDLSS